MCFVVCVAWLWVFDWHFKGRMPQHQQKREDERSDKKRRERSPVRRIEDSKDLVLVLLIPLLLGASGGSSHPSLLNSWNHLLLMDVRTASPAATGGIFRRDDWPGFVAAVLLWHSPYPSSTARRGCGSSLPHKSYG